MTSSPPSNATSHSVPASGLAALRQLLEAIRAFLNQIQSFIRRAVVSRFPFS